MPARACPHPTPAPRSTHHGARDPSQAIRPGLPRGALGANGASLPRRAFQASFPLQGRQVDGGSSGPADPGHGSETPGALAETPDTPRHPQAASVPHIPVEAAWPILHPAAQSPVTTPTLATTATVVLAGPELAVHMATIP